MTEQQKQLKTQLWNIANDLRGKMGADEFRDYILGFIFYKFLSERIEQYADGILKEDDIRFTELDRDNAEHAEVIDAVRTEALQRLGYFLAPHELFSELAAKSAREDDNFILEDLTNVLQHIEQSTLGQASEDDFQGLFEDIDLESSKLGKSANQKNDLISKVFTHLQKIDFRLDDSEADVLGDAYEYLIGQFASGAGKKAGEFYTPQTVSTILAKLVATDDDGQAKTTLRNVYDPTCGSGSLLLRVAKEVQTVGGFYGQEMNPTTYNLARMNMILHDVHYQRFDLRNDDTLEHPAAEHADMEFEAIVANPPFSAKWSASVTLENDDRFSAYGKLAPKTKADFAFVQHMVHHLSDNLSHNGTAAVVLPHGVLFRGAAEGHIRQHMIAELNVLDAVIGLPANVFFGTGIPTCILVLKKNRQHADDILFIDASQQFEKVGNQNHLRQDDIDRIVNTYRERKTQDKFSFVADLNTIKDNDYNLNIPRYVDTFEEPEPVDLTAVTAELKKLDGAMAENDKKIAAFCAELGIEAPIGCNLPLLRSFKQGLMQQLFSRTLRFKDDNDQPFPDWEEHKYENLFYFINTNSFSRDALNYVAGNVKNIHYGDIHTKFKACFDPDDENVPYINSDIDISRISEERYLKVSDLVIADASEDYADIGKCIEITNLDKNPMLAGLHTFVARPKLKFAKGFNAYLMQSWKVRKQIMTIAQGTKVLGLSKKMIANIMLKVPCEQEQTKIANCLSAFDQKIDLVSQQIEHTQTFKQGLLQQMFV